MVLYENILECLMDKSEDLLEIFRRHFEEIKKKWALPFPHANPPHLPLTHASLSSPHLKRYPVYTYDRAFFSKCDQQLTLTAPSKITADYF